MLRVFMSKHAQGRAALLRFAQLALQEAPICSHRIRSQCAARARDLTCAPRFDEGQHLFDVQWAS